MYSRGRSPRGIHTAALGCTNNTHADVHGTGSLYHRYSKRGLETDVDDVTIYCSFPGAVKHPFDLIRVSLFN